MPPPAESKSKSIPAIGISPPIDVGVLRTQHRTIASAVSIKIWNGVLIRHFHVKHRTRRRRLRWRDPGPVCGRLASIGPFSLNEVHVPITLRVVIRDLHAGSLERMQYRFVERQKRMVLPERNLILEIKSNPTRHGTEKIVSTFVGKVPRGDLGSHVVAIERGTGIIDPTDGQNHPAHTRNGVPTKAELAHHRMTRMRDRDFVQDSSRNRVNAPTLIPITNK